VELRRALSRRDLLAYGINQVIGGGIFLMPAAIAAQIGNWSPLAFMVAGFASLLSALCFAEVGSRFAGTGGSYLYVHAAFGRLAAFEIGWIQWFVRVSSQASIAVGITMGLGFFWPAMKSGFPQAAFITAFTLLLGYITARGIRQSAWLINAFTVAKLLPLYFLIAVGMWFIDWPRLMPLPAITTQQAATAALLLAFTFGGFDTISVPAGESQNPRRDLPFAFVGTIVAVTVIFTMLQVVVMTVLPDLSRSAAPLSEAAGTLSGAFGAALIGAGAVFSMMGNNAGGVLAGSRLLFALAENGQLPAVLARIHAVYRTPSNAVWFTTAVALGLALSGSFTLLAAASAVARLVTYAGVAAATLKLRQSRFAETVPLPTFVVPFGAAIPVASLILSLGVIAGATRDQLLVGTAALAVGTILFLLNDRARGGNPVTGTQFP
jgi:basic amino acid/polyamine antiporter, APA family